MTTDHTITFTHEALATIARMTDELSRVRAHSDDATYTKVAESLALSLAQMLNLRPTNVSSDGDFSLFAHNNALAFGVNYCGSSYNEHRIGEWSVNS